MGHEQIINYLVISGLAFSLVAFLSSFIVFRMYRRFAQFGRMTPEEKEAHHRQIQKDRADRELFTAIRKEARYLLKEIPKHLAIQNRMGFEPDGKPAKHQPKRRRLKVQFEAVLVTRTEIWFRVDGSRLPTGTSFYDLKNPNHHVLENLQYGIGRPCRFYEDNQYNFFIRVGLQNSLLGIPRLAYWRDVVHALPTSKPFAVVVGVNEYNKVIYQDLIKWPHGLILGGTGGGKSNQLKQFIVTLVTRNSPGQLQFYFVDLKRTELPVFRNLPHTKDYVDRIHHVQTVLDSIKNEMERRLDLFVGVCNDIDGYNSQNEPHRHLPRVFLIVDELALLTRNTEHRKAAIQTLLELVSLGRATGIHLILCTQTVSSEVLSMDILANIDGRICYSVRNLSASTLAVGNSAAVGLEPPGRCVFVSGINDVQLQSPLIEDKDIIDTLAKIGSGEGTTEYGITDILTLALANFGGIARQREIATHPDCKLPKNKIEKLLKRAEYNLEQKTVWELQNNRYILAPSIHSAKGKTPRVLIPVNGHIPQTPEELTELITITHNLKPIQNGQQPTNEEIPTDDTISI